LPMESYCMRNQDRSSILRIIKHLKDLVSFVDGLDFDGFLADTKTVSACAFTLGQIGELAGRMEESIQTAYPEIPWKSLKGLRNRVVHDHENVDFSVPWTILTKNVPQVLNQFESILSNPSEGQSR
jgi:uncharacterized protein with HEPN domain